jgi:hypothetical protein
MGHPYIDDDDDHRPLKKWETAVDEAIRLGQERGEFDNLPGQGKPLNLPDNPYAGGLDVAYGVLKNANIAPYWIEIDKEIRAEEAELQDLRERTARRVASLLASESDNHDSEQPSEEKRGWWPFRWPASPPAVNPESNLSLALFERTRARETYLERAAKLEEKTAHYNSSLPRELWQLERPRHKPEHYAAEFDAACPPVAPLTQTAFA